MSVINQSTTVKAFLGSTAINKIYFGSTSIFEPAVAAPLPTPSARATTRWAVSGSSMSGPSAQFIPAGDWCAGGTFKSTGASCKLMQFHFNATDNNIFGIEYKAEFTTGQGSIGVYGKDGSGVTLGAQFVSGANQGLMSADTIMPGDDVFVHFQKIGNRAELWVGLNGMNPSLSAWQLTDMGAFNAARQMFFNYGNNAVMDFRDIYFISDSFTQSEIGQIMRGAYPHVLGTAAATDFYLPMASQTNPRQELTSGKTTYNAYGCSAGTAIGYAYDQTEAVYLNRTIPTYKTLQHTSGLATVALQGTYAGASGANIQAQVITSSGVVITPWTTIANGISGGVWSGSLNIPKWKSWLRVQLRKVISGVPSAQVMTAYALFGVGEVVICCGQSLMEHQRETNPNGLGASGVLANGFVSYVRRNGYSSTDWSTAQEQKTVSGVANAGGLIEVTFSTKHGLGSNGEICLYGITGTTEANGIWNVTPTSPTKVTLNGSTFANAYVSGGFAFINQAVFKLENSTIASAAMTSMGNAISELSNCVVSISNRAINGSNIESYYSLTNQQGICMRLEANRMGKIGTFVWMQGHGNSADVPSYFADGGTVGAYTGFGKLGTLLNYIRTNLDASIKFGEVPYTTVGGSVGGDGSAPHAFRMGMYDWVLRKRAAGDNLVYSSGFMHDFHPVMENGLGIHLPPINLGYIGCGSRIGKAAGAMAATGKWNGADGPQIVSASRSGAIINMTVQQNNGTALKVPFVGAKPTGFQFSTTTNFASLLAVNDVQIINATTVRATLAADPGATVYCRYMYGNPGSIAQNIPIITGVADNGAGLIRVTCGATTGQITGGLNLVTDQWVRLQGVGGTALGAIVNTFWQVIPVSSTAFDLKGSSSAGLPAFNGPNQDLWHGGNPSVVTFIAVPIYDDTVIGSDTTGLPIQPTNTYLTAA